MILWIILLAVLLLLALLLLMNVRLVFLCEDDLKVFVKFLFFRIDAFEFFQKMSERTDEMEKRQPIKKTQAKREEKRKIDFAGFVRFLGHLIVVIRDVLLDYLDNSSVMLKKFVLLIGTQDAAQTALLTGSAIQLGNALCALLQHFSHFTCDSDDLIIGPDFAAEKSRFSLHLELKTKLFRLIAVVHRANLRFYEGKGSVK